MEEGNLASRNPAHTADKAPRKTAENKVLGKSADRLTPENLALVNTHASFTFNEALEANRIKSPELIKEKMAEKWDQVRDNFLSVMASEIPDELLLPGEKYEIEKLRENLAHPENTEFAANFDSLNSHYGWGMQKYFGALSDILTEMLAVYKKSGFWDELISVDTHKYKNKHAETVSQNIRHAYLSFFSQTVRMYNDLFSKEWSRAESDVYYDYMHNVLEDEIKQRFNAIEPYRGTENQVKYEHFETVPELLQVLKMGTDIFFTDQTLSNVKSIEYNAQEPPPKKDSDGRLWYTAAEWSHIFSTCTFYPVSHQAHPGYPDANQFSKAIPTAIHELAGHSADRLFVEFFGSYIQPWIQLKLLRALDKVDPYKHPVSTYVAKVVKDNSLANIETDSTRYKRDTEWAEQLAEMTMIFRLNPRQFAIDYGPEMTEALMMYATAADGNTDESLADRAAWWKIASTYTTMNTEEYLDTEEFTENLELLRHPENAWDILEDKLPDELSGIIHRAEQSSPETDTTTYKRELKSFLSAIASARKLLRETGAESLSVPFAAIPVSEIRNNSSSARNRIRLIDYFRGLGVSNYFDANICLYDTVLDYSFFKLEAKNDGTNMNYLLTVNRNLP